MSPRPSASPPRLKLCTWNLHLGQQLPSILRSIETDQDFRNLDLLALQEASVHGDSEDAAVIAARMGPEFRHLQVETHVLKGRVQANALVWNSGRVRILWTVRPRRPVRVAGRAAPARMAGAIRRVPARGRRS